jgi:hypothetical protein
VETGLRLALEEKKEGTKYDALEKHAVGRLQPAACLPRKTPPIIRRIPAVEYDGYLDSLKSLKSR